MLKVIRTPFKRNVNYMKKIWLMVSLLGISFVSFAQNVAREKQVEDPDNLASQYFSQVMGVAVKATTNVNLYKFIYEWIGTPYKFGGTSAKGIDCSAFTQAIYQNVFNTPIVRTSRDIFKMTTPVDRHELKEGDLVFFKIKSRTISHVGIYLGSGRFAHASSSKGVTISSLNEPYYARVFYKGGRVLDQYKKDLVLE